MLIQIYEINNPAEAYAIAGLGVDHIGLNITNHSDPGYALECHSEDILKGVTVC